MRGLEQLCVGEDKGLRRIQRKEDGKMNRVGGFFGYVGTDKLPLLLLLFTIEKEKLLLHTRSSFNLLPFSHHYPSPSYHQPPHQTQHPQQRQHHLHPRPHGPVRPPEDRSPTAGEGRVDKGERQARAEMVDGDLDAGREGVFVEAVLGPGAGVADTPGVLDAREAALGADGSGGVEGVVVGPGAAGHLGGRGVDGVEGDEDVAVGGAGDVLEYVHVIGQADGGRAGVGGLGCGDVVP